MNSKFQPVIFSIILIVGILIGKNFNQKSHVSTNDKINSILNLINTHYVDSIKENFEEEVINSIIKDLDPHTSVSYTHLTLPTKA